MSDSEELAASFLKSDGEMEDNVVDDDDVEVDVELVEVHVASSESTVPRRREVPEPEARTVTNDGGGV